MGLDTFLFVGEHSDKPKDNTVVGVLRREATAFFRALTMPRRYGERMSEEDVANRTGRLRK